MSVSILGVLLVILIAGVVCYFIDRFVPMSPPFKFAFYAVVVIALLLWLLGVFGLLHGHHSIRLT